jgi:hypothetical protein
MPARLPLLQKKPAGMIPGEGTGILVPQSPRRLSRKWMLGLILASHKHSLLPNSIFPLSLLLAWGAPIGSDRFQHPQGVRL